jgi:hypothetical protein
MQGDGVRWIKGMLRYQWAVSLICLLLFVTSVDTIPDPPAINPPSGHSSSISALHIQGSFTLFEKEWCKPIGSARRIQAEWFSLRLAFDGEPASICPLPRIHHAADTSPPSFS